MHRDTEKMSKREYNSATEARRHGDTEEDKREDEEYEFMHRATEEDEEDGKDGEE